MSEHSKTYKDPEEFRNANLALLGFQKRHNVIRKDYQLLLNITETFQGEEEKFNSLYRASLKGFFSLIESDIFGLNQVDKYEAYDDKHRFEDRFKKTFKRICQTWSKEEIIQQYLDSKYSKLKSIKNKRDKLVHPKDTGDIIVASKEEFIELKFAFDDYNEMLHSIMNNFFIDINVKDLNEIKDLFKK
ncbi:hypothetical protein ATO12_17100 [Aquimarina atlantica]|uniref:RiboL-PSP-HEPN domain-containing protein n=1 Tax=Aquimarina atlantica TaxID=1317122 RepID=A0A023BV46_9FLAO|nr:hypothetical protein [Aquimarina atlantica]EZH73653.1 hypothetical protein ATO12_17100 [Aquimarina atlantica]